MSGATTKSIDHRENNRLLAVAAQRQAEELHMALERKLATWVIVAKFIERMQVQQDQAETAIAVVQQGTASSATQN